jgi:hypothetical protein
MLATEGHMIEKALSASDLEPGMQALLGGESVVLTLLTG